MAASNTAMATGATINETRPIASPRIQPPPAISSRHADHAAARTTG